MEYEVKDSGKREEFTSGMVRDTQEGKPRYDLISPFALKRLAILYAKGAEKYTINKEVSYKEIPRWIDQNIIEKIPLLYAAQISLITPRGYVETVMRNIYEEQVQGIKTDKIRTEEIGVYITKNILKSLIEKEEKTLWQEKGIKKQNVDGVEGFQKNSLNSLTNSKKEIVQFVEKVSKEEKFILIMTIVLNKLEVYFVASATMVSDFLGTILKDLIKLLNISKIHLPTSYLETGNGGVKISWTGERNWEKGAPFSRFYASAFRHLMQWATGEKDEDHLIAAIWNLFAIAHFEELGRTDLNDMPKYHPKKDNTITDLDEDLLEQLYWEFDSERNKSKSERTCFKGKMRFFAINGVK